MMRGRRIRKRVVLRVALIVAIVATAPVGVRLWNGNFGEVRPGRIFRAAQLPASRLSRTVRDHRVKTVLNLRGANPNSAWYRDERAATLAEGATQVDLSM